MENEIKLYTDIHKLSDDYFELTYYLIRDKKIVGHGVEDFSRDRIRSSIKFYDIKVITGETVTTTTGAVRRKKETLAFVVAVSNSTKKSDILQFAESEYGDNIELSRTYTHYSFYENFNRTVEKMLSHIFSKTADNKETDSKETDSKETDSKDTDSKETDNKGYMKCEYFFSLSPKSPPKCKYCIYSDRDFCPADGEKYWGICEE